MWLVQRIVPQGVASLTQQLMPIVMVFVIGGGGGVHSTLPSVQHWQKWYLLRYKHRPCTVMTRFLGTSVIFCTACAVFMLL